MTAEPDAPLIRRRVPEAEGGSRLDVFLARQPEIGSRAAAKEMVRQGHVQVDEASCKPSTSLEPGQLVSFRVVARAAPAPAEPVDPPELRVLFEDAWVLVIDKPAGIPVHPPENPKLDDGIDIARLALRRCGSLPLVGGRDRPGIVHRLDKDTSGVMVLAKNEEAFYFLQSQFKARTVRKEYRALCAGDPRFDSDYIEGNIVVDPARGDRMAVVAEGGKEASTYFEVLERFGDVAHVRCVPRTGRTHQIRVHMASIGHPLVGDRLYRGRAQEWHPDGAPHPGRHCLHAWSLRFLHPRTHEPLDFDAPLSDDFERLLRWLRQRAR